MDANPVPMPGQCQDAPALPSKPEIGLLPCLTRRRVASHGSTRILPAGSDAVEYLLIALKLSVALAILSVWTFRSGRPTPFRGGTATTLSEEFAAYGLPFWFMCVVGVLKVSLALALIAAIWFPRIAQPAAIGLGLLMLGALGMHLKVQDPIQKSLPAIGVLAMCTAIALL